MYSILDLCFGDKEKIDFHQFQKINEEIASDTLLSVLNLFREKLPCSENFWRYKRNYEIHMGQRVLTEEEKKNERDRSPNGGEIQKKTLASPKMTNVKPLSPYLAAANRQRLGGVPSANPLMRYSMNKKDPKDLIGENGGG
jgi:hypothetical protein